MNIASKTVKERLFTIIDQLSEEAKSEVLDFTESLLTREKIKKFGKRKDPILEYIGGVSHGTLARNIDSELYGGNLIY